jgi:hypothetical protein
LNFSDKLGFNSPSTIPMGDDVLSSAIVLPFPFSFYGTTYTNVYVSSNGYVTFDPASGSGCCSGQYLPNGSYPNNLIALCWEDLNTNSGGSIGYFTAGNKFVIQFDNVAHYGGGNPITGQIVLNSDSTIDIHATNISTDFDGYQGETMGIENAKKSEFSKK